MGSEIWKPNKSENEMFPLDGENCEMGSVATEQVRMKCSSFLGDFIMLKCLDKSYFDTGVI